jgi:hypothetical protein
MQTYCVDFDDLYDGVAERTLDHLLRVKEAYPPFVCTLFTIPNRTSDAAIEKFKAQPWIALAPHGWHHTRGECLTWPYHEAEAKILLARAMGIDAPAFRAPAWLINRATYEVCRDQGIVVCDHKDNYLKVLDTRVYRYNDPAWRKPKIRPIHGHLTDCAVDNFIDEMAKDGRLTFAKGSEFIYPWDAAKRVTEDGGEDLG